MEEKELTDEEIVKALELCVKNDCEKCPYLIKGFDCVISKQAENDFLDLIHRLQDENKALLKENEALSISFYGVQNQARERCEELQKQVDELKELSDGYFTKAYFYYQKCKAYGIENFYDDELEPKPAKEGKTITFPKFEHIEVE